MIKDKIVTIRFSSDAYKHYTDILHKRGLCFSEVLRLALVTFMEDNFIRKCNTEQTKTPFKTGGIQL